MNKRMNLMFTIAAIAVMGGALFGSSFTSQMTGAALAQMLMYCRKSMTWAD